MSQKQEKFGSDSENKEESAVKHISNTENTDADAVRTFDTADSESIDSALSAGKEQKAENDSDLNHDDQPFKTQKSEENGEFSNEIDDFVKGLLEKKTEMALYPREEEAVVEEEFTMSEEDLKEAENELSEHLDKVRKERGQVPIDQEEEDFNWTHIQFRDLFDENGDDDFTTQSLFPETKKQTEQQVEATPSAKQTEKVLKRSKPETARKDKTEHFETVEKRPQPVTEKNPSPAKKKKRRKLRKQAILAISAVIACILLLFGAYYYKVRIYDPAHQITEEMQSAYDRLVAYADEFDKMSDAEKNELLVYEEDYNKLNETQKKDINEYFTVQTGKTFTDLLAELKAADQSSQNEDDPSYQDLLNYVNSYASLSEEDKQSILGRLDQFNALSYYLQGKINEAMNAQVQTDFMGAYQQVKDAVDAQNAQAAGEDQSAEQTPDQNAGSMQAPVNNDALKAEYQAEIDSLATDRANYAAFLEEQGLPVEGDEMIADYDASIAYWQAMINQLQ